MLYRSVYYRILDYSKNKRRELVIEQIHLKTLCDEILDNVRYAPEFKVLQIDFRLEQVEINQDKTRLKIILNNFLTNAVKFQKKYKEHRPYVKISSFKKGDDVRIEIEDNGEGIKNNMIKFSKCFIGAMKIPLVLDWDYILPRKQRQEYRAIFFFNQSTEKDQLLESKFQIYKPLTHCRKT